MNASSLRRLMALTRKEAYQMMRDPSTILIAFILPITLLLIFGYGVNFDANQVRLGIVSEDQGEEAHHFFEAVDGTSFIIPTVAPQFNDLSPKLKQGKLDGIVIIPTNFSEMIASNKTPEVQLITDASQPNTAQFTMAYHELLWQTFWEQKSFETLNLPKSVIIPRYWYNQSNKSQNAVIPGSIAITMTIIGALLTSLVVAREWERGTMEGLLSTPITRGEFLLSKIIPYFILSLIVMIVVSLITIFIIGIPFHGNFLILLLMSALFSLSALGTGLLISTLTKNQFNAAQLALFSAFLPAVMLSGFIYEVSSMPIILQKVTAIIPARYFVTTLQSLFHSGNITELLIKNGIALVLLAIFWLTLCFIKTKKRLD